MLFLRDDDIPQAVSMGVADLGIVGQNEVAEKGYDVEQAMPLGFGACRLSLAVPNAADYTAPTTSADGASQPPIPTSCADISHGRASKPRSTPSRDRWRSHRP